MRNSLLAILIVVMAQSAYAFEYLGVQSGQSVSEVTHALSERGLSARKIAEDLYILEGQGPGGWAYFCHGKLHGIGMSVPYKNLPDILRVAIDKYGNAKVWVQHYGFWKRTYQIVHDWNLKGEQYSISMSSEIRYPIEIVEESWGLYEECVRSVGG